MFWILLLLSYSKFACDIVVGFVSFHLYSSSVCNYSLYVQMKPNMFSFSALFCSDLITKAKNIWARWRIIRPQLKIKHWELMSWWIDAIIGQWGNWCPSSLSTIVHDASGWMKGRRVVAVLSVSSALSAPAGFWPPAQSWCRRSSSWFCLPKICRRTSWRVAGWVSSSQLWEWDVVHVFNKFLTIRCSA